MTFTRDLCQEIDKTLGLARGLEQAVMRLGEHLGRPAGDIPEWDIVRALSQIVVDRLEDIESQHDHECRVLLGRAPASEKVVDIHGAGLSNRQGA